MSNDQPAAARYLIQSVSRRVGIKPDLIRAWERRYQAVTPVRSDGGQRLYSEQDIRRLSLLNRATEAGHSIGRIAALPTSELENLLRTDSVQLAFSMQPLAVPYGDADRYVDDCYAAALNLDADALDAHLQAAITDLGVSGFIENLVAPLMKLIGDNWQAGALRPVHEHLASVAIRSSVYMLRTHYPKPADAPSVVIATPVNQLHELGALFAAIIAENNGWRSIFLGPNLPAEEIAAAVKYSKAQAMIISIGHTENAATIGKELRRLLILAGNHVALIAGGQAAENYRTLLDEIGAWRVDSYAELRNVLTELRR